MASIQNLFDTILQETMAHDHLTHPVSNETDELDDFARQVQDETTKRENERMANEFEAERIRLQPIVEEENRQRRFAEAERATNVSRREAAHDLGTNRTTPYLFQKYIRNFWKDLKVERDIPDGYVPPNRHNALFQAEQFLAGEVIALRSIVSREHAMERTSRERISRAELALFEENMKLADAEKTGNVSDWDMRKLRQNVKKAERVLLDRKTEEAKRPPRNTGPVACSVGINLDRLEQNGYALALEIRSGVQSPFARMLG